MLWNLFIHLQYVIGRLVSSKPSPSSKKHRDRQGRCEGGALDGHLPFLGAQGSTSQDISSLASWWLLSSRSVDSFKSPLSRTSTLAPERCWVSKEVVSEEVELEAPALLGPDPAFLDRTRNLLVLIIRCGAQAVRAADGTSRLWRQSLLKPRGQGLVSRNRRAAVALGAWRLAQWGPSPVLISLLRLDSSHPSELPAATLPASIPATHRAAFSSTRGRNNPACRQVGDCLSSFHLPLSRVLVLWLPAISGPVALWNQVTNGPGKRFLWVASHGGSCSGVLEREHGEWWENWAGS